MLFKEATAVWKEDTVFDITPDSGFTVRTDGSTKAGVSPMEMILMGLAGCMGADVIDILRKKRQPVTRLEIKIHGDRTEEHPKRYTRIALTFVVSGAGLDPEAVRRAIELSETTYCSVSATLRGGAQIETQFDLQDTQPALT